MIRTVGRNSLTILVLAALPVAGQATDYTSPATVNATFQCPESLPDDGARARELAAWLDWMRGQHPDWSMPKLTGARIYLLERTHCEKTLAAIQSTRAIH